jgi:glutamate N-acetyltransferase/amino-acid N-acetyltransferase
MPSESGVSRDRNAPLAGGASRERDSLPKVEGFRFAGICAGIKKNGRPDLALVVADAPAAAAAVFTRNLVRAAPVEIAEARVRGGRAQAVLVNSGNANACTGEPGERAALEACRAVAEALGLDDALVLPASTGVIGQQLPEGVIPRAAPSLVEALSAEGAAAFATAILTTDKAEKVAHRAVTVPGGEAVVLGVCKGAGMIHPNMATTLGFVFTDARLSPATLQAMLKRGADRTFNRISVDGDTSTNDTLVLMASGKVGDAIVEAGSPAAVAVEEAIAEVLEELAIQIVSDGEGAEHAVRIDVRGAAEAEHARKIAMTIATSPLVKTALHGCDPNWGRIVAAAGRAGVPLEPTKLEVRIGDVTVFEAGRPVMDEVVEARASAVMKAERYVITVELGAGEARDHYFTSDLGHEYVRINADYRS